jgi:hypothetical protein
MALKIYTNAQVYLRGKLLCEAASVKIDRKTNATQVATMALGFSGATPGAGMCEISVESKVPSADFEVDPGSFFVKKLVPVDLTVFAAGRTFSSQVLIHEDNFSAGVNQDSALSFNCWAPLSSWDA